MGRRSIYTTSQYILCSQRSMLVTEVCTTGSGIGLFCICVGGVPNQLLGGPTKSEWHLIKIAISSRSGRKNHLVCTYIRLAMRHDYEESSVLRERKRHLAIGGIHKFAELSSCTISYCTFTYRRPPTTIINYGNTTATSESVCSQARLRLPARDRFRPTKMQLGEALMSSPPQSRPL